MKIKKVISIICLICFIFTGTKIAEATHLGYCHPPWNGTRTVESSCTFPASGRIYGNIIVGANTLTVPTGVVLGIALSTQTVTFTTGRINFQGTGKMDASISNRYQYAVTYNNGTSTGCPSPMTVLNSAQSGFASTWSAVASSGTMYCAYP